MKPQHLHTLKQVSLSDNEREVLWQQISARKESALSEYNELFYGPAEFSWKNLLNSLAYTAAPIAMFAFLLVSAGTSLPGDSLYGFKTGINEELQRLTTFGTIDKFELEKSLLTKRVMEAKELKTLGLLDEKAANSIEDSINKQANKVIKSKTQLDPDRDDEDVISDESEINDAVAVAEIKGAATGSIQAVRAMAGVPALPEVKTSQPVEKDDSPNVSGMLAPYEPEAENREVVKPVLKTQNEVVTKATIQAKAIIVAAEAELAAEESKSDDDDNETESSDEIIKRAENAETTEYVSEKIKSVKESTAKELDSVETEELLEALEQASAAKAASIGLSK